MSNLGVDHSRVHGNQRQIISFVCHRRTPHMEVEWIWMWWHPSFLFPWAAAAAPAIISGSHEECGVLYLWCNFRFGRKSNGKDAVKEIYKFKEYVKYLKYIYI